MANENEVTEQKKPAANKEKISLQTYLQMKPFGLRVAFTVWLAETKKTIQTETKEKFDALFDEFMNAKA